MDFPPIEIVVDDPHRCICIMSGNPFPAVTLYVLFCVSSFLCFISMMPPVGILCQHLRYCSTMNQLMNTNFPDRQLVCIGIMCLYTIYICFV